MKILKSKLDCREIFDTENLELVEPYKGKPRLDLKPLRYVTHPVKESEYLKMHFGSEHSILLDFDSSFYFSFKIVETPNELKDNCPGTLSVNILDGWRIHELLTAPRVQVDFFSEYIERINSFRFNVETYRSEGDDLKIQNMDLWIESYIEMIPDLQLFRNLVRSEMKKLGIKCHPDYIYLKNNNHYYYNNISKLEELRATL